MKKLAVLAAVGALMISGCASSGNAALKNETNETISEKLQEGMAMADVRAALGDPFSTTYTDGGNIVWNYEFVEGQATAESFIPVVSLFTSGMEGTKKQLVILFDDEDNVQKFNLTESDFEQKTGIIRQ